MITTSEVLALAPGPALDRAIHEHVFSEETGPALAYSTDTASAALLFARLPLFVARLERPKDQSRPWVAGTLAPASLDSTSLHTTLTVSGPTMLGVLCRAALLVAMRAPESAPPAVLTSTVAPAPLARRTKRAASTRANGAKVATKTPTPVPVPVKPKERAPVVIRQPSIFLGARSKLSPIPKRKPFVMPADPAK